MQPKSLRFPMVLAVALAAQLAACSQAPTLQEASPSSDGGPTADASAPAQHCTLGPAIVVAVPQAVPESVEPCSECGPPYCSLDRTFSPNGVWVEPGGALAVRGAFRLETDQGDYTHVGNVATLALYAPAGGMSWTAAGCEDGMPYGMSMLWSRPWRDLRVVGARVGSAMLRAYNAQGALAWSVPKLSGRVQPLDRPGSDGLYVLGDDPLGLQANSPDPPVGLWEIDTVGKVIRSTRLPGKDLQVLGFETDKAGVRLLLRRQTQAAKPPVSARWVQLGWDGAELAAHDLALPEPGTPVSVEAIVSEGMDGWLITVANEVAPKKNAVRLLRLNGQGKVLWSAPWPKDASGLVSRAHALPDGGTILLLWTVPDVKTSYMALLRLDANGEQVGSLRALAGPVAGASVWYAAWSQFAAGRVVLVGPSGNSSAIPKGAQLADTVVGIYDFEGNWLAGTSLGIEPSDEPISVAREAKRLVIVREARDSNGKCLAGKQPCRQVVQVPIDCN